MIGVILWNDTATSRAVIWCEDHGGLAYVSGSDNEAEEFQPKRVGDVVTFDLQLDGSVRRALNVSVIKETWGKSLAGQLKSMATGMTTTPQPERKIIPFRAARRTTRPTMPARLLEKQGT